MVYFKNHFCSFAEAFSLVMLRLPARDNLLLPVNTNHELYEVMRSFLFIKTTQNIVCEDYESDYMMSYPRYLYSYCDPAVFTF